MVEDRAANKLRTEKGSQYSANRVNTSIDTLRSILEIGVENGVIGKNPVNGLGKRQAPPDQLVLPTSSR
jgi:hypothetical protein